MTCLEHFATSINHAKRLGQENKGTLYLSVICNSEMHEYAKARETTRQRQHRFCRIPVARLYTLRTGFRKNTLAQGETTSGRPHYFGLHWENCVHFRINRGIGNARWSFFRPPLPTAKDKGCLQKQKRQFVWRQVFALREQRDAYKAAAAAAWARLGNTSEGLKCQKRYIALNDQFFRSDHNALATTQSKP